MIRRRWLLTVLLPVLVGAGPGCGAWGGGDGGPAGGVDAVQQDAGLALAAPLVVSEDPSEKPRLGFTTYGVPGGGYETALILIYQRGVGLDAWDWQGNRFPTRDLYATRSTDGGETWSEPTNLTQSATSTSALVDGDGDPATPPVPYYGDSGKPTVVVQGKNALVVYEDRYVPNGRQGRSAFDEAGGAEIPFAAVHVVRSRDAGRTWSAPERLTDGARSPDHLVAHASSSAVALAWQEDPNGLQPGEGEGPGEGGSGAKTSPGTDIWWTALSMSDLAAGKPFPAPVAVTDNDVDPPLSGASRPAMFVVGMSGVLAYEESKGGSGGGRGEHKPPGDGKGGDGKYVRYHLFGSALDPLGTDQTAGAGWIVSDAGETARRARIAIQQTPGPSRGLRLLVFWRQGTFTQGGPADVVGRVGRVDPSDPASTGLRLEDLSPAVSPTATTGLGAAMNDSPLNLSSRMGLSSETGADPAENARAHRAILRGDGILLAYVWTPDWVTAETTDLETYELYVRRSLDAGGTWDQPRNLSHLPDTKTLVAEPRLAGTPSSPDPAETRDPNVVYVAWGTQQNGLQGLEDMAPHLDVFVLRTPDFGATYEASHPLAATAALEREVQMRASPDGRSLQAVWHEDRPGETGSRVLFRACRLEDPPPP